MTTAMIPLDEISTPCGQWCPDDTLDRVLDSALWTPLEDVMMRTDGIFSVPDNALRLGPGVILTMKHDFAGPGAWRFDKPGPHATLLGDLEGADLGNTLPADSWIQNAMDYAAQRVIRQTGVTLRTETPEPKFRYKGLLRLEFALVGVYEIPVCGRPGVSVRTSFHSFEDWLALDQDALFPTDRLIIERLFEGVNRDSAS